MLEQDGMLLSFHTPSHLDVLSAVLHRASPLVANLAIATACAIGPGEMSSLADQLSSGLSCAPQLGAGLHVRAGFGAGAKCKLTLTVQAVAGAGQVVGQCQLLLRLVQQTVS